MIKIKEKYNEAIVFCDELLDGDNVVVGYVSTKAQQKMFHICLAALLAVCLCLAASGCSNDTSGAAAEQTADSDAETATGTTQSEGTDDAQEQANAQPDDAQEQANAQPNDVQEQTNTQPGDAAIGAIEISFNYKKQPGHASNQFAVWIEDANGGYVTTLYATDFTANGGWKLRATSIPDWVKASGVADGANIDAVSGATPSAGVQKYTWDFTDSSGGAYEGDKFTVVVEGTLRWDNQVVYRCEMDRKTGEIIDEGTEFLLRASNNEEKLTADAPEISMLTDFKVASVSKYRD
jgi:hypothetical protein